MVSVESVNRHRDRLSSGTLLAMACLAPWAFGAVEAWAEFGLGLGVALLAVLGASGGWKARHLFCAPSLAVAGLALLALAQAIPLPATVFRALAPSEAAARARLSPREPERVIGDPGGPVPLPRLCLSQDPEASLASAARLAAAWVLFQAVLGLGDPRRAFRRFGLAVAINAALLALFSVIQWLSWNGKIYWLRASPRPEIAWYAGGPFICHNHLAAYLNLGIGLAAGLLLGARQGDPWFRSRGARSWAAYGLGILIVGQVASHSRGGFLAMLVAGLALVIGLRCRRIRPGAGLAGAMVLAVLFLAAVGSVSPLRRLATLADASSDARWQVWRASLSAWLGHPVCGTGLGSFPAALAPFGRCDDGNFFSRAENEYLDLLVEGGVIGLGLALLVLAAIVRLARRAWAAQPLPHERALVLGAMAGGVALLFHWLCDFSLHIPGVAITVVVLSAYLCRLGLDAAKPSRFAEYRPALARPAVILLGLALAALGFTRARAESRLWGTGIPTPGTCMPTADLGTSSKPDLERMRGALEGALRDRPGWAEGHLRLGMTLLALYQRSAAGWLDEEGVNPVEAARMADPLWLHGLAHPEAADRAPSAESLLDHEPIRLYLVPAARSFLEARRRCPVLALPHALLGCLDFLLDGGDPGRVHVRRTLDQAGADRRVLALAAALAVQLGDRDLAARCWRRSLEARGDDWEAIADASGAALSPDQVLRQVLAPDQGRFTVWFADRLYAGPEDAETRATFHRAALERLPRDGGLTDALRLLLQARACARLGDRDRARRLVERALAQEPLRGDWRSEYIFWLMDWGEVEEAHRQAKIGRQLCPDHPGLLQALAWTSGALARGKQ